MQKMLIADDNENIAQILENYAKINGFEAVLAYDGEQALRLFEREKPDIILLDVMMPKLDGFSVCRRIREKSSVPIIMITAKTDDFDRIMGLDIGADDYVVKPFSPAEVMARVRAVMRRVDDGSDKERKSLSIKNLTVDISNYTVTIGGEEVTLTKKEIEILWVMIKAPGRVFTRNDLLDCVWGYEYFGDHRTVDTHIKRLRSKIEQAGPQGWSIETVWGVGYKLVER